MRGAYSLTVCYRDQIVWGFSLPLNNQQEKNNVQTFGLLPMGQGRSREAGAGCLCQKVTPKSDLVWFQVQVSLCSDTVRTSPSSPSGSYPADVWSTSKFVHKHLYRKTLSQKAINYTHLLHYPQRKQYPDCSD